MSVGEGGWGDESFSLPPLTKSFGFFFLFFPVFVTATLLYRLCSNEANPRGAKIRQKSFFFTLVKKVGRLLIMSQCGHL